MGEAKETKSEYSQAIIDLCWSIAEKAHEGQFRTRGADKGLPYLIHPKRVSESFPNGSLEYCAAVMHDTIEDTRDKKNPVTVKYLLNIGVPLEIVDIVVCVTKLQGENYFNFIHRIGKNIVATRLKIADIEDNMTSLEEGSLKDKYRFALEFLKRSQDEEKQCQLQKIPHTLP